jgi:hypothetical protein
MPLGSSSLLLASMLALSPFSTPWTARTVDGGAWPTSGSPPPAKSGTEAPATEAPAAEAPGTEPTQDPSWDEPDATEGTEGNEGTEPAPSDPAAATTVPPAALPPPVVPGPMVVTRPAPPTGLGLMISAGVTGGLAWVTVFARLAAINRCKTAVGEAVTGMESGVGAASACFRSSGVLVSLTPIGWILNDVTYGLAPAAGAYRGKYDGVRAAWDGAPNRPAPVFVGVGAGLLAGGVVGRIATMVAFWRQFGSIDRVFSKYPLGAHFVLAQLSAASIQTGGGLLAYGLSYQRRRNGEENRRKEAGLAKLKVAPQLGWSYSGVALSGRF